MVDPTDKDTKHIKDTKNKQKRGENARQTNLIRGTKYMYVCE